MHQKSKILPGLKVWAPNGKFSRLEPKFPKNGEISPNMATLPEAFTHKKMSTMSTKTQP